MDMDKEFENFIDKTDPDLFFLVVSVEKKLNIISELYKTSIENIPKLPDSEKNKVSEFIDELISNYEISINQLDLLISEELGENEEPDETSGVDLRGEDL